MMSSSVYADNSGKKFLAFHISNKDSVRSLEKFVGGTVEVVDETKLIVKGKTDTECEFGDYVVYISNHPSDAMRWVPVEINDEVIFFEAGSYMFCKPEEFHRNFKESLKWEA